ncbi:MAG TPA: steroid 3-ketoacyl-CoA thiolase [Solirubrobacterales bacterium]|nr:steroid 3-ketoacyl-CoA thiolase [Solirubrobacterales bacterium]
MTELVVVDAVRTPVGKRNGALSGVHPAELLGHAQKALIERTGIDPEDVGQVIGGCVGQVGEQTLNIARTAWLGAGLPVPVAATTVDAQCGSSQQATAMAAGLVAAGAVDTAIGCGVESMSRIPMGTNADPKFGDPMPDSFRERFEVTTQFEGAERIAEQWEITRHDTDEFGLLSQQRAAAAWDDGRFDTQIVPVVAPTGENGDTATVTRDEGLRATTLEKLAALKPVVREDGVHTAGNASQISDGASAVLVTTAERAKELGLTPKARIVDMCLVGSDPVLMLTGPIEATRKLLSRNSFELSDIDVFEVNEAFASVVLAWQRELDTDIEKTNPNGGAIALGHPLGGTGGILIAKTVHEMERADLNLGMVTMCCGGGLGTGMVLERI